MMNFNNKSILSGKLLGSKQCHCQTSSIYPRWKRKAPCQLLSALGTKVEVTSRELSTRSTVVLTLSRKGSNCGAFAAMYYAVPEQGTCVSGSESLLIPDMEQNRYLNIFYSKSLEEPYRLK